MVLQSLLSDIEKLVSSSVVKFDQKAKKYETSVSARFADIYSSMFARTDTYETYDAFDISVMRLSAKMIWNLENKDPNSIFNILDPETLPRATGINDAAEESSTPSRRRYTIGELAANPSLIPETPAMYRDIILSLQRNYIRNQYNTRGDLNNYYRELSGFPNLESSPIYLTDDEYIALGITESDDKVPIHSLSSSNINKIKNNGILDKYKALYPDQTYLNNIGTDAIDALSARQAKNFTLLKTTSEVPSTVYDLFHTLYAQNRDYVMHVIYNRDMYHNYEMYDNFIGLIIMIMTIQRMISSCFKKAIQRDLYDWTFIKNLYASYNIPFLEDLSLEQHVILTKNFNRLLQYKGTDKVLFDICSLFGTDEITINKYYLVKDQKTDDDGNPIISDNPDEQYNLQFRAVNLAEENVHLAIQNSTNTLSYSEVVEDDPYWWDSGDLKNTILEKEFNYIESKYISLSVMYKATEMMLDSVYAFRLILDKGEDIRKSQQLTISLPRITSDKRFNLFDIMVFLIAITCRNNGFIGQTLDESHSYDFYVGNVPTAIEIAHVYGFNFDETAIKSIQTLVNDNENILDKDVVNYFNAIEATYGGMGTNVDVSELYANIKGLRDALANAIFKTQSTEDYYIYKQIHNILLTEESTSSMFTVDGVTYPTYASYIEAVDPDLYAYIDPNSQYTSGDRNTILEHVLAQLEESVESFGVLNYTVSNTPAIYNAIMDLIRFFKSYTVDIHTFNIIYLLDDKFFNTIKMIDKMGLLDSTMWTKSYINGSYADQAYINVKECHNDNIHARDNITVHDNESDSIIYPKNNMIL